ncbi:MAG TPA: hypothetical protein VGB84_06025, partial [Arachidicoccus sp.]
LVKRWKLSPVDKESQKKWDKYTQYIKDMFVKTNIPQSPWIVVNSNNKKKARLESIKYVLSAIPYSGKEKTKSLELNPKVISVGNHIDNLLDV